MARQSRMEDIIKWFGIATLKDIAILEEKIDEAHRLFQSQIDQMVLHHNTFVISFSNHKKKTDEELKGLVVDVSQIIVALELLQKVAHAESHIRTIKRMTTALKAKRTKALKAIDSIGRANSEGQIDIALAEAANG